VRALQPETTPRILLCDTVGFISKLPHALVASFQTTLDEAHEAGLLLFVVDAADPFMRAQLRVTQEVIAQIGAQNIPARLVLNKMDRLSIEQIRQLRVEFPTALHVSAHNADDMQSLRAEIVAHFDKQMETCELLVPYKSTGVLGELRGQALVLHEEFTDTGVLLKLRTTSALLDHFQSCSRWGVGCRALVNAYIACCTHVSTATAASTLENKSDLHQRANVPWRSSISVCSISAWVFITNGP
jgi:GTP-binding protein HflX